jgi:membrane associated rhomboid family serine protease
MAWEDRAYNREGNTFDRGGGGRSLRFLLPRTPLAITLIVVNVVIFFVQAFSGPFAGGSSLVRWGALTFHDSLALTEPWRWITYQYLHGSGSHLFFNMIGLYFFVPILEQRWGWKRALAFYTAGGIAAGVTYGIISIWHAGVLIGASGSLLAVLGAVAVIAPDMQVLAMMVIPLTMRMLAILYAVLYTFSIIGDRSPSDAAHLGGLAFGAVAVYFGGGVFSRVWSQQADNWRQKRKLRRHRMVQEESDAIDRILQKVHDSGMNSLSRSERQMLKRATERQRKRDLELSRTRRG